jgi:DNA-binding response OmpR family regulator
MDPGRVGAPAESRWSSALDPSGIGAAADAVASPTGRAPRRSRYGADRRESNSSLWPRTVGATMRVLVVEDSQEMADVLVRGLRRDGMAVDVATDGEEAWAKLHITDYDVVVLDRDLPLIHGDDICDRMRFEGSSIPILMLTAAAGPRQAAEGLGLGADDYMAKPFAFVELIARLQALVRRPSHARPPVLEAAGIQLDTASRTANRFGRPLELARKEFGTLEVLMAAQGRVVSAEELLEKVWDEHADPFTTAVRTTIKKLRDKLGPPDAIETLIGSGYRIGR